MQEQESLLRVAEADEARMERVEMENRNLRHSLKEARLACSKLELRIANLRQVC
jgi:hypothetical protein